jgi:glycosyltransferase involved in cell wall biosynthesis
LATWDIAVVPSIREPGTPRVILEAFACGAPVLAFATGGIPEVIEDGKTGILVDPPTAEGVAKALVHLMRDDCLRAALSANGRREWARRFTVERYRTEVLESVAAAVNNRV